MAGMAWGREGRRERGGLRPVFGQKCRMGVQTSHGRCRKIMEVWKDVGTLRDVIGIRGYTRARFKHD